MTMASERDTAAQRLQTALAERDDLRERWLAVLGRPTEFRAYARYRVTSEEIAALQAWLDEPTDEGGVAARSPGFRYSSDRP
jgi:hypothetical protein